MPDHFAALDQPRRPWLEIEVLKQAFHRASATCHPDVAGSGDAARFAAINAAHSVLRDPVARMRHLLELEASEKLGQPQAIPPELADLFMNLAAFRQVLTTFLKKEGAVQGLARALLVEERLALEVRARRMDGQLKAAVEASVASLKEIDAAWEHRGADTVESLAALHQRFAYVAKWRSQLAESLFQLSIQS